MEQQAHAEVSEATAAVNYQKAFAGSVQQSLQQYFVQLGGEEPANLYNLVLAEMEIPKRIKQCQTAL